MIAAAASLAFALVLAAPPAAKTEDAQVKAAVEKYSRGEYEAARKDLQEAVRRNLPKAEKVRAHVHLGFCEVAFGNRTAAKVEFKQAILLDNDLKLDPTQVSPKIIDVFEEAKNEMNLPKPTPIVITKTTPVPTPTAIVKASPTPVPTPRIEPLAAAWRSAAAPGWGQYEEGRVVAAATFAAAEVTAIGFTIWNQQQVGVAQKNVKRAQLAQKGEMRAEVREFESYRNLSILAIVGVAAAASTDAWLGARRRPRVVVAPTDGGAAIAFSAEF